MHIATVRSLHRFPVKSMGGEIVQDADQVVGIYASVKRAGRICVGDPVTLC
jgi:uncharacterized protein YcbX